MASSVDQCLVTVLQRYIKMMLERVSGLKVLILDDETIGIVSLVYGQSEILENEVYLVEKIDPDLNTASNKSPKESMRHLNAVYFIRPTADNILRIVKELKQTEVRFGEYHLFFTSTVSKQQLERIAKSDEQERVHQVQEYFADIFVINPFLFSLELPSIGALPIQDVLSWSPYEESIFKRIGDGLLSGLLCSIRTRFLGIRFPRESEICRRIANQMQSRFGEEDGLFNEPVSDSSASNLLSKQRF